jgi:hypothetical protein
MTNLNRPPRRAGLLRRSVIAFRLPRSAAAAVALAACALGALCAACGRGGGSAPPAATGAGASGSASGSAAHATSPLPDACELLTAEDVQTVTREVSGSLSSTLEDAVGKDPTQCSYSLGGVPPRLISLSVRHFPSADEAASQQRIAESGLRSIAAGAPVEELPHLGDGTFWVGGQIDQLNVRRGDTLLVFTVQLDKDPLAAGRTLAGKVLTRLARPAPPPHSAGAADGGSRQPRGSGPS